MDALSEAIDRCKQADSAAQQSALAFALGPEQFVAYMEAKANAARQRIEAEYLPPQPASGVSQAGG